MGEENDEKRPGFDYFVTHKGQGKYFDTEFNVDGDAARSCRATTRTSSPTWPSTGSQAAAGDKPFLLMLGHKAPHSFYFPEPKYEHAFDDVEVPYPDIGVQARRQARRGSTTGSTPGTASTARCSSSARSSPTAGPRR